MIFNLCAFVCVELGLCTYDFFCVCMCMFVCVSVCLCTYKFVCVRIYFFVCAYVIFDLFHVCV